MNEILCWLWGAATMGAAWLFSVSKSDAAKSFWIGCALLGAGLAIGCGISWLCEHAYIGVTP